VGEVANNVITDELVKAASNFPTLETQLTLTDVPPLDFSPPVQQTPCDPFFGPFLEILRNNLVKDGSEFGTGLFMFSLAVTTRAKMILEIGRNRGFTTFAFASALKFIEQGWDEHPANRQRPDIDYAKHEARTVGKLFSLDINPHPDAEALITAHGLDKYVGYVNADSQKCVPTDAYDIMLIDGDHTFPGCLNDVQRYVPFLRPGGYFILHDYYGWYQDGINYSPIKAVCDRITGDVKSMLIDTGCQSLMVFRKEALLFPVMQPQDIVNVVPQPAPVEVPATDEKFVVE
jgi:hypothetical protein